MARVSWKKAYNPDGGLLCAHVDSSDNFDCRSPARWTRNGNSMCAKHVPKPPAKRKAFKRWTSGSQWDGQIIYTHGTEHAEVHVVCGGVKVRDAIVRALNRARVTLPAGRRGK